MSITPDPLALMLAGLYDEPVSDEDAQAMADRLVGYVGVLLESRRNLESAQNEGSKPEPAEQPATNKRSASQIHRPTKRTRRTGKGRS